jgi:hypothetical protein
VTSVRADTARLGPRQASSTCASRIGIEDAGVEASEGLRAHVSPSEMAISSVTPARMNRTSAVRFANWPM